VELPDLAHPLIYSLLALAVVIVLALAGATIRVRRGQTDGSISLRSIIRALLGHSERDRNDKEPPP
jgi:uncharacterized membrane protein